MIIKCIQCIILMLLIVSCDSIQTQYDILSGKIEEAERRLEACSGSCDEWEVANMQSPDDVNPLLRTFKWVVNYDRQYADDLSRASSDVLRGHETEIDVDSILAWIDMRSWDIDKAVTMLSNLDFQVSMMNFTGNRNVTSNEILTYLTRMLFFYSHFKSISNDEHLDLSIALMQIAKIASCKDNGWPLFLNTYVKFKYARASYIEHLNRLGVSRDAIKKMMKELAFIPSAEEVFRRSICEDGKVLVREARGVVEERIDEEAAGCMNISMGLLRKLLDLVQNMDEASYAGIADIEREVKDHGDCALYLTFSLANIPDEHIRPFQAMQDDLRIRLALELYERDHGEYPDVLASLTPGYLDALPVHPFGSGAYERQGSEYVLRWSLAE